MNKIVKFVRVAIIFIWFGEFDVRDVCVGVLGTSSSMRVKGKRRFGETRVMSGKSMVHQKEFKEFIHYRPITTTFKGGLNSFLHVFAWGKFVCGLSSSTWGANSLRIRVRWVTVGRGF